MAAYRRHGVKIVFTARHLMGVSRGGVSHGRHRPGSLRQIPGRGHGGAPSLGVPVGFGLAFLFTDQLEGIMADVHRVERWLVLLGLVAVAHRRSRVRAYRRSRLLERETRAVREAGDAIHAACYSRPERDGGDDGRAQAVARDLPAAGARRAGVRGPARGRHGRRPRHARPRAPAAPSAASTSTPWSFWFAALQARASSRWSPYTRARRERSSWGRSGIDLLLVFVLHVPHRRRGTALFYHPVLSARRRQRLLLRPVAGRWPPRSWPAASTRRRPRSPHRSRAGRAVSILAVLFGIPAVTVGHRGRA